MPAGNRPLLLLSKPCAFTQHVCPTPRATAHPAQASSVLSQHCGVARDQLLLHLEMRKWPLCWCRGTRADQGVCLRRLWMGSKPGLGLSCDAGRCVAFVQAAGVQACSQEESLLYLILWQALTPSSQQASELFLCMRGAGPGGAKTAQGRRVHDDRRGLQRQRALLHVPAAERHLPRPHARVHLPARQVAAQLAAVSAMRMT